jgi:phage terminase large subunit
MGKRGKKIESKILKVNPTFSPLFRDDLDQPRYYNVFGGRGSGKSFVASVATVQLTYSKYRHNILYLRQTMNSIEDSSYKDIMDAIEFLGKEADFRVVKNRIINKVTGSIISFKGIRSTTGAKLKSLSGFTTLIIEEAMEVESFEEFSKIDEGIRVKGKPLKVILLYNPGVALGSWIHDEWFIEGKPNPEAFEDTIFMHSTFLDNEENLNPSVVQRYKDLELKRPKYYINTILAEWTLDSEGRVYDGWDIYSGMADKPDFTVYGLDFGYGGVDSTSLIKVDYYEGTWYLTEIFSKPNIRMGEVVALMKQKGVPLDARIYADYAVPLFLTEIRLGGYKGIRKCKKGKVTEKVKIMQDKNIVIIDEDKSSQLYYGYITWSKDEKGKLPHEPDSLAAARYGILSCNPRTDKRSLGRAPKRITKTKGYL